jgi:hypothetical protein
MWTLVEFERLRLLFGDLAFVGIADTGRWCLSTHCREAVHGGVR